MKRACSDVKPDAAIKRTKLKTEPDSEPPESYDACEYEAKDLFAYQVALVNRENAKHAVTWTLGELSAGRSFEDSADIVRSLDDLLERNILSSEIIDLAIDTLLRMAAEIDEEIYPSYRVEHIYSLLCKFSNHLTCASPLWQNLWDALERVGFYRALTSFDKYLSLVLKCLRNSSLCSARLCCLLSLTHLAIQRRDWLRQTTDGEHPSASDIQKSIETLLAKHTADYDHRIRIRALDCLANGNTTTRRVPSNSQSVRLRLVDHAFSKICYAMQDISVSNRVEAAKLLGHFRGVSDKFLEQTLDKKLLKQMKVVIELATLMTRDSSVDSQSNEWATGRMFGADAPAELLDGSYVPLIDSESCGAFIAGLEDEHMESSAFADVSDSQSEIKI
ncbi:hypothetical protein D918_08965 [Trichuris suis]|nr:hypothetical protein D918_08965 [Trichuris suis]